MSSATSRWQTAAGSALALRVVDRLKKGKSLDKLGLETSDQRFDLRGLPAAPSPASKERQVGTLVVQEVSGLVELKGRSLGACKFRWGRPSPRKCIWRDLQRLRLLERKDERSSLLAESADAVRFAGRVEEVLFEGRELGWAPPVEMVAVDFSDAQFVNVEFRGYRLRDVVMPRDEDVFLISSFPRTGRKAIEMLATDESPAAQTLKAVLENSLRGPGRPADSVEVFNRRDWREWGGEDLLKLAEATVKQAEADSQSS